MTYSTTAQRPRVRAGTLTLLLAMGLLALSAGSASALNYTPANGAALVQNIQDANANPGADTILLNSADNGPGSLYLPEEPMTITDDLTIRKAGRAGSQIQAVINGGFVDPLDGDTFIIDPGVNVTIKTLIISGSSAFNFAVFHNSGNLTIERSALSGNGGTNVLNEAGATLTVNNSTITDNSQSPAVQDNGGVMNFNNATVTRNTGGIISSGETNYVNTVVSENIQDCFQPPTSVVASLDSDGTCGFPLTAANPGLGATQTNGGPTPTRAVSLSSPLRNAGNAAACPTVDQRYFVRSDGLCDIGAFEQGAAADNTPPTCTVTGLITGPPKQQQVTVQDTGSGMEDTDGTTGTDGISNIVITNGTVSAPVPISPATRLGRVLTATKTDQLQLTRWSFDARDLAGNLKDCR